MNPPHSVADSLRRKFEAAFHPLALDIEDESARHAGHAGAQPGGQTHFRVRIVSAAFAGLSRVARQRLVYAEAADDIAAGLHALALSTLTPEEAQRQKP
jgi:BolA protein